MSQPDISGELTGQFWGGYCPDCLKVESMMCKNHDGKWECPVCHLQVSVGEKIVILSEAGIGRFVKKNGIKVSVLDSIPPQEGMIGQDLRFFSATA